MGADGAATEAVEVDVIVDDMLFVGSIIIVVVVVVVVVFIVVICFDSSSRVVNARIDSDFELRNEAFCVVVVTGAATASPASFFSSTCC